jgi:hypothetical protein
MLGFASFQEDVMSRWSTDFLIAQPNLVSGVASVLDLWGTLDEYNMSKTGMEADSKALLNDWCNVGDDIASAMRDIDVKEKE